MATGRKSAQLSQLWQFPLLLVSLSLFGVAAYLFISPHSNKITIDDKIAVARAYLAHERPDAAIEQLNRTLQTEENILPAKEAVIHLMLGEALESAQEALKLSIPENHQRIIQQTRMGLLGGAPDTAAVERRLGNSYAALGDTVAAVDHYRQAIQMDPDHALNLRRKMSEILLADEQYEPAFESLNDYLDEKGLTAAERSWALGQKALLLIDRHQFTEARKLLAQADQLTTDPIKQGELNYQLGYCAWVEGDSAQAERYLRLARDQMKPSHPTDGDACYVLGRIFEARNDPQTAESYFEVVLQSHPESLYAPLARMGRGICRIMQNDAGAGLADLHDLTIEMQRPSTRWSVKSEAINGLRRASALLANDENYPGALEAMTDEQQLTPKPNAEFYQRLGEVYENCADQLDSQTGGTPAEQIRRGQQRREMLAKAGDAYIAYSRALTMTNDKGYGDALWHGIDLYDSAGDLQRVISALELFVAEMPGDKLAPDALLRLGRAYQAAGLFDKAIKTFQRNQFRYPNSLAASKSAVPLAEAYIGQGPDQYAKAEKVLLDVVQDSPLVDPGAEEFHQALFELAQLYYRTQRYEEAISRLEEMAQRYPADPDTPRLTFLMADSYRKSASKLDARLASTSSGEAEAAEAAMARRQRLTKARELFDKVLDLYSASPPTNDEEKVYRKLSCFYRADCTYDLGRFEEAVKLYEDAAFQYQDDPCSLAAYVQIVNSYCALGKPEEAKAANERAKWMVRRMPETAFENGEFSMPKKYWEDWLKWTSTSGLF
jgi:tetratricopeptide (TPR) repeat protein